MKSSLLLGILLLAGCASLPREVDVILDTTPEPAAAVAWLAPQLAISKPIAVQDGELFEQGRYGETHNLGDWYLIVLDYRLEPAVKVMVLIHELAHVVAWEQGSEALGHGPAWGEAYAEVFRVWVSEK